MVIIGTKTGQLANRLFAFAHFIGNAIEFGYPLFNPSFLEYRPYFEATRNNTFLGYPIRVSRFDLTILYELIAKVFGRYMGSSPLHKIIMAGDHEYDLGSDEFRQIATRKPLVICYGWLCRDYENMKKHGDAIRGVFTPLQVHRDTVADIIRACRKEADVVVGVHIRRGDYKEWCGGDYYFYDPVYQEKMLQLARHPQLKGKRIHYLLASNEALDPNNFSSCQCSLGSGHLIEDLYALAACDYIIGPPSTYSMWASFYDRVPLMVIDKADKEMSAGHFEIVAT